MPLQRWLLLAPAFSNAVGCAARGLASTIKSCLQLVKRNGVLTQGECVFRHAVTCEVLCVELPWLLACAVHTIGYWFSALVLLSCVYAGHRCVSPFLVSLLGVVVLPVGGGSWLLTRCLLPKFVVDSFLVLVPCLLRLAWWGVFESLGVVSGGSGVCSYVSMLVRYLLLLPAMAPFAAAEGLWNLIC